MNVNICLNFNDEWYMIGSRIVYVKNICWILLGRLDRKNQDNQGDGLRELASGWCRLDK